MNKNSGSFAKQAAAPPRRFRNRVLFYLAFLSAPPLIVWFLWAYDRAENLVANIYEHELQSVNDDVSNRFAWIQQENLTFAKYLAMELEENSRKRWNQLVANMTLAEPMFYNIHVMNPDGMDIARSDSREYVNYADREYFKRAMKGEPYHQMLLSRVHDKKPAICSSYPVYEGRKTVTAVAAICRFLDVKTLDVNASKLGKTGHVFVADKDQQLLVYPRLEMQNAKPDEVEGFPLKADQTKDGRLVFEVNGTSYISFRRPLNSDWTLIALQERDEIYAEVREFLWVPMIVGLGFLAIAFCAAFFAIDRSILPLVRLTSASQKLGPDNFDVEVAVSSNDEIGILSRAFNEMTHRLRSAFADLKEKEHQLSRYNDELEERVRMQSQKLAYSTKMSSLGEMAGSVAHEINNPLAIISLRTQKLRESIERGDVDPAQIIETLDKIEKTGLRINQIIRGLRAFSRDGSHDPMELENLSSIVVEAAGLCIETAKNRGIEIRVECPESIEVECQPVQIGQVILNLLNNARDAAEQQSKDRWVSIQAEIKNEKAVIRICDSGPGIPQENWDKIMQPFFTTKKFGQGTGLGLSISKGIIEQHHGHLRLDTNQVNTCFVIELPLRQPSDS